MVTSSKAHACMHMAQTALSELPAVPVCKWPTIRPSVSSLPPLPPPAAALEGAHSCSHSCCSIAAHSAALFSSGSHLHVRARFVSAVPLCAQRINFKLKKTKMEKWKVCDCMQQKEGNHNPTCGPRVDCVHMEREQTEDNVSSVAPMYAAACSGRCGLFCSRLLQTEVWPLVQA